MRYHFECKKGWMNDPNGLVYFKGKYHAFFQHYPFATHWGQMHWGHAVSDDLINWEELDIALYPDKPYENSGGCFSGSAIVKDNRLYLFYTSVSEELGQTQSMAYSDDGLNFIKYEGNPVIKESPLGDNKEFRDPKVFMYDQDKETPYRMVVGAGINGIGKILLFKSADLIKWDYVGEIISDISLGPCAECPDLFYLSTGDEYPEDMSSPFYDIYKELGMDFPKTNDEPQTKCGKWVLMFSSIKGKPSHVLFMTGDFDGKTFKPESDSFPVEIGPDFYAPQTFEDKDKRRILIGWMYNWQKRPNSGATHVGAFTIPRELSFDNEGRLTMNAIREVSDKLKSESVFVKYDRGRFEVSYKGTKFFDKAYKEEPLVRVLEDVGVVEIFINGGIETVTAYVC